MAVIINGDTGIDKITDGSIVTADFASTVPLGTKNIIINGAMQVAQRGTSTSSITSGGYHSVDRFAFSPQTLGTWTMSQDTDVPGGQGFANSVKMLCTTADASPATGDFLLLSQGIEGQNLQQLKKGTANAESVTLSFWVKSNKTGLYIAELFDGTNARHINKSFTIDTTDTWEKKTITYAGDTTGTLANNNSGALYLYFWLGAGSTYTSGTLQTSWGAATSANRAVGVSNLADTTSNYMNITAVQLEVGDTATPFEHRPYDIELARCQRYYYKWNSTSSNNWVAWAMAANTTNMYGHVPFPVTMRSNASSIDYSGLGWWLGGAVTAFSAVGIAESGTTSCTMNFTSTGLTAQKMYAVLPNGSTNYIAFNAEL